MLTTLLISLVVLGGTLLTGLALLPALILQRVLTHAPRVDEVEEIEDRWATRLVNPAPALLESLG